MAGSSPTPGPRSPAPDLTSISAAELLPLVYDELRRLAASRLAREGAVGRMQPTSLVHSVYVRLVENAAEREKAWNGKSHFFAAAALAMRRILIERARQRASLKRGGGWKRIDLDDVRAQTDDASSVDMLALDAALTDLEKHDSLIYRVVMLRYFAGLSVDETAAQLEVSPMTVKRRWALARLWLLEHIAAQSGDAADPPDARA